MRGIALLHLLISFGVLCFWIMAALAIAWMVALLCPRHAALRHLVRLAALVVIVAAPVLAPLSPPHYPVRVPVPPVVDASVRAVLGTPQTANTAAGVRRHRHVIKWRLIGLGLAGVWAAGAAAAGYRAAWAPFALRRLYRNSEPGLLSDADRLDLANRAGIRRPWRLRLSTQKGLSTALTWGTARPVVLLPAEARSWSPGRLDAVLIHELAHVRRHDSLTQFFAFLVCAIYWFHPAVWLTARALRQDAEIAADDRVLASGVKPSFYAGQLLQMAALAGSRNTPSSPIGASALRPSKIETRIRSIVDPHVRRQALRPATILVLLALLSTCVALAIVARPSVSARIIPATHIVR
jgi:beta-lactamase regulating signal transducer with metallopeptidase domain